MYAPGDASAGMAHEELLCVSPGVPKPHIPVVLGIMWGPHSHTLASEPFGSSAVTFSQTCLSFLSVFSTISSIETTPSPARVVDGDAVTDLTLTPE